MLRVVVYNIDVGCLVTIGVTNSTASFQEILNGYFELYTDVCMDNIRIFVNEDYQYQSHKDESHLIVQLDDAEAANVYGTILFARHDGMEYKDLTDEDIREIRKYLKEHRV